MPPPVSPVEPPDFFHVERDEEYLRLLREEEQYWDARPDTLLTRTPDEWVQEHQNQRLTGDRKRPWNEAIHDYGPFYRCCSLGAGPGDVEANLLREHDELHVSIYDISGESLKRLQERLGTEFPGRVEVRQEDFNFIELPADAFDLVISQSSIHHVMNLEHLAFQINRTLTPEGYFFLRDTVGESYFQFSDEKKHLFEVLTQATSEDAVSFLWPDRANWEYSPFEAARSGEILEVLERYLRLEDLRTVNALMEMTLFVRPGPQIPLTAFHLRVLRFMIRGLSRLFGKLLGPGALPQFAARGELTTMLDGICSDSGYFKPGLAFARYRKRLAAGPPASG